MADVDDRYVDDDEHALEAAADALEFRLDWLGDYGEREYGANAPNVTYRYRRALEAIRAFNLPAATEIVARYDVDGFTAREVDALVGELSAMAESSDTHPDARLVDIHAPDLPREGRTVLVHLNFVLPPDAPATADDLAREITAALEIAAEDPGLNAPALAAADNIDISAEET